MAQSIEYSPGLAGVPAAESSICLIDGQKGELRYRGFRIEDLADSCTFEQTTYLLLFGNTPSDSELEAFVAELSEARNVPADVWGTLRSLPKEGHPMAALTAGVAALGMHSSGDHVEDASVLRSDIIRLIGGLPTIVAAWHRIRNGQEPVAPNAELGHAANFLYMLTGSKADDIIAHTMDVALTLHAEHSMNASTFTCRVTGSTLATPYASVCAAICSLSGRLHGGANERVLATLRTIEDTSAEGINAYAKGRLERKEKIMGFGHRVYKVKDPRAKVLQGLASELFEKKGRTPIYDIAVALENVMTELVGAKGIYPNVDFYSGIVYEKMEIPTDLFTPVFAIARVSGWLAHLKEQLDGNRIFRPTQVYVGEKERSIG